MAKLNRQIIAALDIGATKIVCLIAEETVESGLKVIGIGHQFSQGIKSGTITNIQLAEQSIRSAVAAAEQMAGLNIDRIILSLNSVKQRSHYILTEMQVTGQEVSERDTQKLLEQGYRQFSQDGQEVIHCIPLDYAIDDTQGIKNPVGLYGHHLKSELHVVTTSQTTLLNITNCIARCHLDIEEYMVSSYASAYACLNQDEKELGVALIEFGGSTTSVAVFKHGHLVYTETIPIGGMHITNDIALGLSTSLESAERIKTLYGNVLHTSKDDQEMIDVPYIGNGSYEETNHVPRSNLVKIIRPRIDEILEMIAYRMKKVHLLDHTSSIVLSGGGSQLSGLKEYTAQLFQRQTRIGVPKAIEDLAESTKGPAFATVIGMLHYMRDLHQAAYGARHKAGMKGTFKKAVSWLKTIA